MISIVAAVANNRVIGVKNDLPWHLSADLKRFKTVTMGHKVLMGFNTFQSIVARLGMPLPGRDNIVLTRQRKVAYDEVQVIDSLEQLLSEEDEFFVIGGASVYEQTISLANRLYITEVHADIAGDVYFPEIDLAIWKETERQSYQKDDKNEYDYDFVTYDRIGSQLAEEPRSYE